MILPNDTHTHAFSPEAIAIKADQAADAHSLALTGHITKDWAGQGRECWKGGWMKGYEAGLMAAERQS